MRKRHPSGRAFITRPGCEHPLLLGAFNWPEAGGWFGTCADFDCGTTVAVKRPDGREREIVSYARKNGADVREVGSEFSHADEHGEDI